MKILYVANHNQPTGNDDEGAIAYALEKLGHTVELLSERKGEKAVKIAPRFDLLLFHKWEHTGWLERISIPKVFWYFDLVKYQDTALVSRNGTRINWMKKTINLVDLGFCTDGDWVNQDSTGKLIRLTQGADERKIGFGNPYAVPSTLVNNASILFTGIRNGGGTGRIDFVDSMKAKYGEQFSHISKGVHGAELANLIASKAIIVAPDSPITDNYWSNRVYLTLGFGGFLLHPYCRTLVNQYANNKHIVYYSSRDDLHDLITYFLEHPDLRKDIQVQALAHTTSHHTYYHRCRILIDTVNQRIFNGKDI